MRAPYLILPLLVACGAQEQASNTQRSASAGEQPAKAVIADNTKTKANQTKEPRFLQQGKLEHVFNINGTKLRASEQALRPGTQVFDMSIGTFATVKNFLVVISSDDEISWQQDFEVSKLAADTFRLTPQNDQLSMDAWYKRLKTEKGIVRVELGLDYSLKSEVADH
ncbi:hypothetical protein [Shewanella sedimentimangrovi]|uniref:Lipoprotein n=1 Tax=Shewanella sedimentimangrovi TaxID=2814293 RepID=A0ABX7R1S9_9GAMM|nr:hypothetical protein [Shewanella sedimentimangrovi]QSX37767.1 hypothetical protein JYB85_02690 [Shewanella sedimentimangrovi]